MDEGHIASFPFKLQKFKVELEAMWQFHPYATALPAPSQSFAFVLKNETILYLTKHRRLIFK